MLYQMTKIHWSKFKTFVDNIFNSLPNDKFFNTAKCKAFSDSNFNNTEMTIFVFNRVESIVG